MNRPGPIRLAALLAVLLAVPAAAEDEKPWVSDLALVRRAMPDGAKSPRRECIAPLEAALARGKAATEEALEDGNFTNPYVAITLALARYYEDTAQYDAALRVLNLGIDAGTVPHTGGGNMPVIALDAERGTVYINLKRWTDAEADFSAALAIVPSNENYTKAYLYRGRAYARIELGRIDDAEADVKESVAVWGTSDVTDMLVARIKALRNPAPHGPKITSVAAPKPPPPPLPDPSLPC